MSLHLGSGQWVKQDKKGLRQRSPPQLSISFRSLAMKFSFVAVYFTLLVTLGLVGARPVLNLEQRDECGLACVDSELLSRESDAVLSVRAPSSVDAAGPTDLAARFVGAAVKVAKIGVKIGKKIFGGLKKLFRKRKHKKRSAAKAAGKEGNNQHQQNQNRKKKRDLEPEWEEFVERDWEEAADLYERSYDFEGDDVFVRGYDDILLEDLE